MTTDHKDPDITCAVTGATLPPIRQDRVPVSLWIGTGSACDSIMADHLDDWLRGRFLSGNDKSNSYRLLSGRSKTMRVPDASDYPIVVIKGPGIDRMVQNYRRRSGHLPRNKTRAITLGSAKPFFILRCVTRKRVAICTMRVSPITATRAWPTAPACRTTSRCSTGTRQRRPLRPGSPFVESFAFTLVCKQARLRPTPSDPLKPT